LLQVKACHRLTSSSLGKEYNLVPYERRVPMPTPNYDLGILITLNIGLTLTGIVAAAIGLITMSLMLGRQLREIQASGREIQATGERVANICERIDARLRRDFPNIGDDLL
jgi:hypothetical protein